MHLFPSEFFYCFHVPVIRATFRPLIDTNLDEADKRRKLPDEPILVKKKVCVLDPCVVKCIINGDANQVDALGQSRAVGTRKNATAQVLLRPTLTEGRGYIEVNRKMSLDYFQHDLRVRVLNYLSFLFGGYNNVCSRC